MKKFLMTALLALLTMGASAQLAQDTLCVTTNDGMMHKYVIEGLAIDGENDWEFLNFWWYNNDGIFTREHLNRTSIKSIRFFNRYSNPLVLLQGPREGAYEGLFYTSEDPCGMFNFISCLASDEMLGGGGYGDYFGAFDMLSNAGNSMNAGWDAYYSAIENTNTVLERIGFLPMRVSAAERDHTRGEALFLRAFYYYQLASLFGNVPVITDNQSWKQKLSPTSPADVWGRILLDLKEAIALMDGYSPTLTIDDSRVGKYAAEALLARAYLFYAGFHLGVHDIAAQEASVSLPDGSMLTKADVISYVDDCVKNSGFELVGDFRNLWPYTNRLTREDYSYTAGQGLKWVEDDGAVNPEVLFKIKYNKNASWGTTVGYSNQSALYFGYRHDGYSSTFPFGRGWGAGTVSPGLYDEWKEAEPQDMRRDASIQDVMQLPNYSFGGWNDYMQETVYHEKKNSPVTCVDSYSWQAEDGYMPTFEGTMYGTGDWNNYNLQLGNIHPMNIIRLADVLLMQSELTGTVDGMNKVRQRVGLQPLEAYSLAALQQERRWELAFEGVRWNDMRRWGDDYCRQALDKQMGVAIYNRGVPAQNPQGVGVYDSDPRSYGERYAVSRGFFDKPAVQSVVGGPALEAMQGRWTYNQENVSLDYIIIEGTHIERDDVMGTLVAEGEVSIKLSDDYDQRICTLCFTNGTMLPLHSGSESGGQLDVIELSDNSMVLRSGSGEQLELRRRTGGEDMLRNAAGIKWSYGTYPSVDWSTGAECVIGTIGLYSWQGIHPTVGSIGIIYAPHIASTTAADLTSFVQTKGWAVAEGETDPFAYMVFNLYDMTISKYTADGQLIATSSFIVTRSDDYNIIIRTTGDGILVPYLYNGNGQKEQTFNLRYDYMQAPMANYSSPGLVLQSLTEIDNAHTYWMFGRLGFTDVELEGKLKVEQTDRYGTPQEEGFFLKVTLDVPAGSRYSLVVQDVETNTVLTPDNNNLYQVNVRRGETQVKNIRFTLKNANNIDAVAERTFTMTNNAALTEELMLLASELYGSKTWKWDTSVTGAVWGNMGYCGGSGTDVGIIGNGQWWGVTSTDEFNGMFQHTHNGMNNGDGDLDAYMVFNEYGVATTYDRNGNIVRQGDYQVKDYDANAEWRKGMLVTDAILWPYEINSGGNIPGQYEIVYLTPDKLTLVYPDGGAFSNLGSWNEATFWHFKSDSDVEGMAVGYGQNASKDWTWDYDGQNTVWGNMGYCGGNGSEVGTAHNGQWWGVTNEAEFMEQLHHSNTGTAQGDESMNAYFTLGSDGSIVRHAGDGSVIKNGTFSFDRVEGNTWKVANLNTTAGTILFPYEINSGGHMPEIFDVVYLTDKKMCLVYPDGGAFDGLGNWGEATYWHFRKK
ncbi:MAG: RagB/SusD family nutrient uptake outer membrane protein [Prevotella sp.]|nr:RagB/SusD family nutrient uptake outer membrane protein [Prevotella sp.]